VRAGRQVGERVGDLETWSVRPPSHRDSYALPALRIASCSDLLVSFALLFCVTLMHFIHDWRSGLQVQLDACFVPHLLHGVPWAQMLHTLAMGATRRVMATGMKVDDPVFK